MAQSVLHKKLACGFGDLALALGRLDAQARIAMRSDGCWSLYGWTPVPISKTPAMNFGNASTPTLTARDIPRMGENRIWGETKSVHLIHMA